MAAEVGELLEARGRGDQVVDLLVEALVQPSAGGDVHRGGAGQRGCGLLEHLGGLGGEPVAGRPPELVDRLLDAVDRQLAVQVGDLVGRAHLLASLSIRR